VAVAWLIARRLFRPVWAAHLVALIFAVHPAYAPAIAWISGGNRVFSTLPMLLSLLLFMQFWEDGRRNPVAYWGSLAAFAISVLYHSASLPLIVAIVAYAFILRGEPPDALRPRSWLPFAPFIAVVLASVAVQLYVRGQLESGEAFRIGLHQYLNYAWYLSLSLIPVERFGEDWEPMYVVGSAAMLALTLVLLMRRPIDRLALFGLIWFYASLFPDSTLRLGAFGRVMYASGVPLAIVLVSSAIWFVQSLPARWGTLVTRAAPYVVVLATVPVIAVAYNGVDGLRDNAAENERFARQLRAEVQSMPAGSTLYVAPIPRSLRFLAGQSHLDALVHLYLGQGIIVREYDPANPPALGPDDRLLRYAP
jgi:hypothetical protein